ncbi:MAG: hypothetical protein HQM09_05080 [Candidatus Riflebacteria bacterium]|nr:hypothetical protein [Candidatus Riflebacteria bacterium]
MIMPGAIVMDNGSIAESVFAGGRSVNSHLLKWSSAGQGAIFLLIALIIGFVGLFYGSRWYNEKHFITLYDNEMVRYIEIPPFAQRKTPVIDELVGKCTLELATTQEQANTFLAGMANRKGFTFRLTKTGFEIDVTLKYKVTGRYNDTQIFLTWKPRLPERLAEIAPLTGSAIASFPAASTGVKK